MHSVTGEEIGVHLAGAHVTGVHVTGVHVIGVHLINVRMIRYEMVLGIDLIDLIVFLIILIDCLSIMPLPVVMIFLIHSSGFSPVFLPPLSLSRVFSSLTQVPHVDSTYKTLSLSQ